MINRERHGAAHPATNYGRQVPRKETQYPSIRRFLYFADIRVAENLQPGICSNSHSREREREREREKKNRGTTGRLMNPSRAPTFLLYDRCYDRLELASPSITSPKGGDYRCLFRETGFLGGFLFRFIRLPMATVLSPTGESYRVSKIPPPRLH